MALVIVTTDVALNIYGKAAPHGPPPMRLMEQKKATALIMDLIQMCPAETFIALAVKNRTVVAVGGRKQELDPFTQQDRGPAGLQVQTFVNQARPSFAAELLLARSKAAPGAPDTAAVHHLTETRRFDNPLATYLSRGRPTMCNRLRASTALGIQQPWTTSGTRPHATSCTTWGTSWANSAITKVNKWARGR